MTAMSKKDPADLPTMPCSVVWSDGHPWVLDGEPGIGVPESRVWVGTVQLNGRLYARRVTRATMLHKGFSVVHVEPPDEDEVRLLARWAGCTPDPPAYAGGPTPDAGQPGWAGLNDL